MRILLLPNIGLGNINADSDFYDYSKLIDVANRYYDDMYFYLVLSERHVNQVTDLPRTKIIAIPESSDYGINEHMTTFEFVKQFHLRGGRIMTDGMYTSRFHPCCTRSNKTSRTTMRRTRWPMSSATPLSTYSKPTTTRADWLSVSCRRHW